MTGSVAGRFLLFMPILADFSCSCHYWLISPVHANTGGFFLFMPVREYKGWVRNVALIKCTLGPGKPKEGWNFGREGTGGQMGNKGS
jgi:hypothetical protein